MSKNKHRVPTATTSNNAPTLPVEAAVIPDEPHAQFRRDMNAMAAWLPTSDPTFSFVQFHGVIAVEDTRGQEELTDRARVGLALGPHGPKVTGIALVDGWFTVATEMRSYEVPVSNVRSARR